MHLSVIIPAYNEAERIGETLEQVLAWLAAQDYDAELIVVDDGSVDDTMGVVEACIEAAPLPLKLVRLPENQGKGAAVREGMGEASGAYRVFMDADGSTPVAEIARLWEHFEAGAEVVIGSRALRDSVIETKQPWYRRNMGRIYNIVLRILGLTHFKDTQCGFKGFTAKACDVVFPRQTIMHFSFDAELLYIAARHGLRIDELPVHWHNSPLSRVHPLFDSIGMFLDLLAIRLKDWRGAYK